jgi:hypothetical protein
MNRRALIALIATVAAFALTAAPASAQGLHEFRYSFNGSEAGAFPFWIVTGVGVDNYPSSPNYGHVYVGANGFDKVSNFTPGPTSATFDCNITGAGENSTDPHECAKEGPAVPVGEFRGMFGVAVDPSNGNVYAADIGFETPHEINMFNSSGVLQKSLNLGKTQADRIAAAPGALYIANETNDAIEKWEPATETLTTFSAGSDTPAGRFGRIGGVAVDTDPSSPGYNDVYAVDRGINEIQAYTPPPAEIGGVTTEYTLTYEGQTTKPLHGTAPPEKIAEELEELSTVRLSEATRKEFYQGGNIEVRQVGSEYQVEFVHGLGTTDAASLEIELLAPSHQSLPVTTVRQGIAPALDKLNEHGEYQCQITGSGEESTSASECSKAQPGVPGVVGVPADRGFDTNGFISGAAAVDPSNGHVYFARKVETAPREANSFHSFNYVDEFSPNGDFLGTTELEIEPFDIGISASSHDLFFTELNQFQVDVFGGDRPEVRTGAPSEVTAEEAVLHGEVNPLGLPIEECNFEYVEAVKWKPKSSEPYAAGSSVPCEGTIGTGNSFQDVEAHITGLQANKTYYFRIVAKNANGTSKGKDEVLGAPYAGTYVATEVGRTSAKLNGVVNPDHGEATYYFEYGTDTSYGSKAPVTPAGPLTGDEEQEVSEAISGLQGDTTYHYRIVASDASGTVYGRDHNFTTSPPVSIDAIAARRQTKDSAILQAYVNPLGAPTTYHFEYGKTTAYGQSTAAESAGSGSEPVDREAQISGLQPGTEYHFRTVASNPNGAVTGPDQVFLTEPECPEETEKRRQEQGNPGTMLPDCRAFERVSPEEKGSAPAGADQLGTTGEYLLYASVGVFAGNEYPLTPLVGGDYLAHRTAEGWVTESIHPTTGQVPLSQGGYFVSASPDLTETLWGMTPNNLTQSEEPTGTAVYRRSREGAFGQVSPTFEPIGLPWESFRSFLRLQGENVALTHLVVESGSPLIQSDPYPVGSERLYDVTLGPTPSLSVIDVTDQGNQLPGCLGAEEGGVLYLGGEGGPNRSANAITPDGSRIFFECRGQIYARIDQSQTVPISEPESNEECLTMRCATSASGGLFSGASEDGSKVFFLGTHPLVDEGAQDTLSTDGAGVCAEEGEMGAIQGPNGCNFYMYDFNRPAGHNLIDISGGVPAATETTVHKIGFGPQVKYVLRTSPDGSHVYFVARGLLTDTPNSLGQSARQGAENLYYYNTETEKTRFIAELCRSFGKSGTLADPGCFGKDNNLTTHQQFSSSNGAILTFDTYSQITPDDENSAVDVYRYDANTDAIERVSIGHNGEEDHNGNAGGDAILMPAGSCQGQAEAVCQPANAIHARPMTGDGSMIIFGTARPLQNGDNNEAEDFYEWHDGQVSLISGAKSHVNLTRVGPAVNGGTNPVISTDGRDIAFATDAGLVPGDVDELGDVYDARVDGGFKPQSGAVEQCHGSATCAGQLQTPPESPSFGSETFSAAPQQRQCHRGFVEIHRHCVPRHPRHPHHRRGHRHRRGGSR